MEDTGTKCSGTRLDQPPSGGLWESSLQGSPPYHQGHGVHSTILGRDTQMPLGEKQCLIEHLYFKFTKCCPN